MYRCDEGKLSRGKMNARIKSKIRKESKLEGANYRVDEKKVSGESSSLGVLVLLRPASPPRQKHPNKRIIYWRRRKEGEG